MTKEERKLTKAEEKRLQNFNNVSKSLEQEGYVKYDLTTSVEKANMLGALYGLIVAIPFIVIFFFGNKSSAIIFEENFFRNWIIFFVTMLLLIVVHELIHGFTWAMFAKSHFKAIEFGVIWKMLTPYCTCKEPLNRTQYMLGTLMPCIVLGILPCVISWFNHNLWFLEMGAIMILSAGGDLLICKMILNKKTNLPALYLDHPTSVGLAMFIKENNK
ncbi:MAG: DUF3267 domain-containing protein [Solobacterium sp.]|nr:DUF3267 domain-containing protein [Solobacterium sp.]